MNNTEEEKTTDQKKSPSFFQRIVDLYNYIMGWLT